MKGKNNNISRLLRNLGLVLGYLLVFIAIPFLISGIIVSIPNHNQIWDDFGILIFMFIAFVAPFLFYIPYRRMKLNNIMEKIIFVVLGLIIPYIFIYLYLYNGFIHMFDNFHPMA